MNIITRRDSLPIVKSKKEKGLKGNSEIKKQKTSYKNSNVFTAKYLEIGDNITIFIPEEFLIHGIMDPKLQDLEGIVKEIGDFEALVYTKDSKEIVNIPLCCLLLKNEVLSERMEERDILDIKFEKSKNLNQHLLSQIEL
jgi:hypothetical protein